MGTSAMGNAGDGIFVTIGSSVTGLITGMEEGAASVRKATHSMEASLEELSATVNAVMAPLLAITALLAGGELFEQAIEKTEKLGEQLGILSAKTGVSAEALSSLKYAAEQSETSFETLSIGLTKLARTMNESVVASSPAHQAFKDIGVQAVDTHGKLRPMDAVLLDVSDKFSAMENGAKKSALAMQLFGRSGTDLIPFLNEGRAKVQELREEAERLGITMSDQDVAAAKLYGDTMKTFHATLDGLEREMALGLMPALTELAKWFVDSKGKTAEFGDGIVHLRDFFKGLGVEVVAVVYGLSALTSTLQAVGAALILDFTKAGELIAKARADLAAIGVAYKASFFTGAGSGKTEPTGEAPASVDKEAEKKAEEAKNKLRQMMMGVSFEFLKEMRKEAEKETTALQKTWLDVFDGISKGWQSAIGAMSNATMAWADVFRTALREMLLEYVGYEAKRAIIRNAHFLEEVKQGAIRAAVNAYASIAAIPVVGPFLAPAAALAALAGVLALAHGGGGGASSGSSSTASAPSRGSHTTVIYAMDAKSFHDYAMRNSDTFAKASLAGASNGVRMPTSPGRGSA